MFDLNSEYYMSSASEAMNNNLSRQVSNLISKLDKTYHYIWVNGHIKYFAPSNEIGDGMKKISQLWDIYSFFKYVEDKSYWDNTHQYHHHIPSKIIDKNINREYNTHKACKYCIYNYEAIQTSVIRGKAIIAPLL